MRQKYIFHHDHYYHTLKGQIGAGIPVFHGVRQRGGGIGSILGGIAKYALPLLMKYVFPHAKEAALRTLSDVAVGGQSVKGALKKNSVGFLKNVGGDVLSSATAKLQTGKGIRKVTKSTTSCKPKTVKKKKNTQTATKRKLPTTKKGVVAKRTRLDIFS